jgi:hypothetical protein
MEGRRERLDSRKRVGMGRPGTASRMPVRGWRVSAACAVANADRDAGLPGSKARPLPSSQPEPPPWPGSRRDVTSPRSPYYRRAATRFLVVSFLAAADRATIPARCLCILVTAAYSKAICRANAIAHRDFDRRSCITAAADAVCNSPSQTRAWMCSRRRCSAPLSVAALRRY